PSGVVYIQDNLRVENEIYGGSGDGQVKFSNDVDVGTSGEPKNLEVYGNASFYEVQTLDNNGNPITVQGSMDVGGDINVQPGQGISLGGDIRYAWPEFETLGIENLLRNPGFEDPDRTFAWNDWGSPLIRDIRTDSNRVRHGLQSMRIETSGANQGISQVINNLRTDGTQYQVTGWIYVVSGTPVVMIYDDDYNFQYTIPGTGWVWFNETIVPDTSTITLYLGRSTSGSNGRYFFDSFMIEEGDTGNKFRPRHLNFEGEAGFNDLSAVGDLYVDDTLTANNGLAVLSDASISGTATITGNVDAGSAEVAGDVKVTTADGRLMGAVNLRKACDSASPRMYTDSNRNFIIEIGSSGSCAVGESCVDSTDCASGTCDAGTGVCV
ncbi:carbohydrate binding domain-containing protein, partial [Bacteroidota bacterium]